MKNILTILLLLTALQGFSQEKYRLTKNEIFGLLKNSEVELSYDIFAIQSSLDNNESYLRGSRFDKFSDISDHVDKIKRVKGICCDCYLREYDLQIAMLDSIKKSDQQKWKLFEDYLNSPDEALQCEYYSMAVGGNINLEIPADTVREFWRISGKFLDIFPVWEKYFDAGANFEQMAESNKHNKWMCAFRLENKDLFFQLVNRGDNNWIIERR